MTATKSSNEMKILGFHFGDKPTVEKHIEEMSKKFRRRLWFVRHLKNAIKSSKELVECYSCFVRPIAEYCSNVFHPMLSKTQTACVENLQFSALKIIFGFDHSKSKLLELAGIPTLAKRRERLFSKFCQKIYSNPRFNEEWLPTRPFINQELKHQNIIIEKYARTERLFRSPLYTIRSHLNECLYAKLILLCLLL